MNLHQTPEDIIKAATPQQKIIWNYIFLTYGERATVSQLHYHGTSVGSEFLTYNANKMYFALNLEISDTIAGAPSVQYGATYVYNEANAAYLFLTNNRPFWDATAAAVRFLCHNVVVENLLFSRLLFVQIHNLLRFEGYRITF